jgi:hypothetical protein
MLALSSRAGIERVVPPGTDAATEVVATSASEVDRGGAVSRRYYEIGGLTVQVESDLPITDDTFHAKFRTFQVDGPGADTIVVRHHFGSGRPDAGELGRVLYEDRPWTIYGSPGGFTYVMSTGQSEAESIVVASTDHSSIDVFNGAESEELYRAGGVTALTLMTTDQIVLARAFAERRACFLHSCGVVVDGRGLLFVGHSGAGKSTMMSLLASEGEALCDDRNIVRVWDDGVRVHGCWSHGEVPVVSSASAPLGAVLFLSQADANRLVPLKGGRAVLGNLLPCVIKPLVTADWWERTLDVIERVVDDVPCYVAEFDRSGAIVPLLRGLTAAGPAGRA